MIGAKESDVPELRARAARVWDELGSLRREKPADMGMPIEKHRELVEDMRRQYFFLHGMIGQSRRGEKRT